MLIIKKIKNRGKRTMSFVHGNSVDRKTKPYKALTKMLKGSVGRMRSGRISVRHRGGGVKRRYRQVDFGKKEGEFKIDRLERDPNRSAFIALVTGEDDKKYYMLASNDMVPGDVIKIGNMAEAKKKNRVPLLKVPTGALVSNIELSPGSGGKIARSGGSSAIVMGMENGMAQLKMPSGEIRLVSEKCLATLGQMSNPERNMIRIGKAGRVRLMGRRPQVRGKAMNPVDHPHGGGEGNQSIGLKHAKTLWGRTAMGVKTRKKKLASNKFIIRRRKKKKK